MTALVVVLPVGIFNQWLVDAGDVSKGSPAVLFFWLLILFGGAAGGWAVIRLCQSAPLSAAAGAAALAYAIVQGLGVVKRVIWGPHEFSPVGYIFLALLMATCGMLGGLFGRRWQREQERRPSVPGAGPPRSRIAPTMETGPTTGTGPTTDHRPAGGP